LRVGEFFKNYFEIFGGRFAHGFAAAGIGRFGGGGSTPAGFIRGAVLGGIASEVTGGKLRNGAATAAFTWALSQGANRIANSKSGVHYDSEGNAEFYLADAHERQKYLDERLGEFRALIGESEGLYSYANENVQKMSVTYDSSYEGVAVIRASTGEMTVGPGFFSPLPAPVEATATQAEFINALLTTQKEMFVFKHELAHMHPDNRAMLNAHMVEPARRVDMDYEVHATTRAYNWARRVYGE